MNTSKSQNANRLVFAKRSYPLELDCTVRVSPEAKTFLKEISRKSGEPVSGVASKIIVWAKDKIEIVE